MTFVSRLNMASSLTQHLATTWMQSRDLRTELSNILESLELSASLDERITLMEDFHLHAFFMFERKFESRNVRIFDVDGKHPNIVRGYRMQTLAALMLAKRATLSQEDLTQDNYELRWIDMVESE